MSHHDHKKHPKHNRKEILKALEEHGLDPDNPSQLSDAFRFGWIACENHDIRYRTICFLIGCVIAGLIVFFWR